MSDEEQAFDPETIVRGTYATAERKDLREDPTRMDRARSIEARLRAVEDRLEIQVLTARISDSVNGASDSPIWEIGPPLHARGTGISEIIAVLRRLRRGSATSYS